MRRSTISFLRLPSPLTVSAPGSSSGSPSGSSMPAGGEERPDAVGPRLAVDVAVVVGARVERHERLAGPLGALAQERVEHLLPGAGVDDGGPRDHAVEVEEAGAGAVRQPQRLEVAIHGHSAAAADRVRDRNAHKSSGCGHERERDRHDGKARVRRPDTGRDPRAAQAVRGGLPAGLHRLGRRAFRPHHRRARRAVVPGHARGPARHRAGERRAGLGDGRPAVRRRVQAVRELRRAAARAGHRHGGPDRRAGDAAARPRGRGAQPARQDLS